MNARERFNRFMNHEPVDHIPDYEFWFWDTLLEQWDSQGLPDHLVPSKRGGMFKNDETFRDDLAEFFGFSHVHGVGITPRFVKAPKQEIIAEDEDTQTVRTELGEEMIVFKPGKGESIPTHIKHAIETRDDWLRVRDEFLPVSMEQRIPENWGQIKKDLTQRDYVVNLSVMSFYGFLRDQIGMENISMAFAAEPEWIEEMMDHMLAIYMMISEFLVEEKVEIDATGWGEDMCYATGPLISPTMFKDMMVPRYKKVTDFWKQHGVTNGILDSDGNLHMLAPLWHEAGINLLLPCEFPATDTLKLRQENPTTLFMRGGFDKKAFFKGKPGIDAEFERLKPVLEIGSYMPHTDHLVPPDVKLSDYMYYREQKMKFIGK